MIISKRIPIFLLRLLALCGSISVIVFMLTSQDSSTVLNITFKAKFTNSSTFMYFVITNAISSVYTLLLLFLPTKNFLWRCILVSDLVITSLLVSSVSASLGLGAVGKKGNSHAGWLPICGQVPKFCDHVSGALIGGLVSTISYFLLLLFSLHIFLNLLSFKP